MRLCVIVAHTEGKTPVFPAQHRGGHADERAHRRIAARRLQETPRRAQSPNVRRFEAILLRVRFTYTFVSVHIRIHIYVYVFFFFFFFMLTQVSNNV